MGATTALRFAVRSPERLLTLVVVGTTAAREPRASVGRRLMDPERILRDDPVWAAQMALTIDPV
jgi:pimeloyl-ACP methyl ester carboxylesterase